MSKPPQSTPHSDIDGVHQGKSAGESRPASLPEDSHALERAHDESKARPDYSIEREDEDGGADDAGGGDGD